jgi:D-amino peptidase
MTKLYISVDLEGISGIVSPHQCFPQPNPVAYAQACGWMADETRLVLEAIFSAPNPAQPVTAVTVNDAHGLMTNLAFDRVVPPAHADKVSITTGKPKVCAMVANLDASYDGLLLLGYHAKAGTVDGLLNHTFHDKLWDVSINGVSLGEAGVNALYAQAVHGVPTLLASGDQALCREVTSLLPHVATVQTKQALSFAAAEARPVGLVKADYQTAIHQCLSQASTQWKLPPVMGIEAPLTLQLTFCTSLHADTVALLPWVQRVDGRTISVTLENWQDCYQALQSCYALLSYCRYLEG